LGKALTELRDERAQVAKELDGLERAGAGRSPADVTRKVAAAIEKLRQLRTQLGDTDPSRLREVLRQMIVIIDLHFESERKRKKTYHRLVEGRVRLRPQRVLSGASIELCPECDRNTSSIRRMPRLQRYAAI
jgi:hypothetical protein